MSQKYSVSLILITMNRYDEFRKTLLSLKEQTAVFELIVVDNGSNDGSPEMVRKYWPEAVVIELDSNKGVSGGRNEGIKVAKGDILVFLDDDAGFESRDALSSICRRFEEDPNLGILATNSLHAATMKPEIGAIPRRDKKIFKTDYQATYFCGVGFALRKDLIKEIGDFSYEHFYNCQELDLSWRAIESGYRIMWAVDIVVLHRLTPSERPRGRWVYYNARNRIWLAVEHLPWRYVISYGVFWWGYLLIIAIKNFLLIDFIKGISACIVDLPKILKKRKVLSKTTLNLLHDFNGRLIY
ncbi:glycosyltransferase [bacterium]|nr:glycosyltransferase [bacterium]